MSMRATYGEAKGEWWRLNSLQQKQSHEVFKGGCLITPEGATMMGGLSPSLVCLQGSEAEPYHSQEQSQGC